MRYADLDNLIADRLPEVKSPREKEALERMIDNVSAFVDSYCKRRTLIQTKGFFEPSPDEPKMKRLRGEGERFLRLPVHVFGSITEVSCNGQIIDSAKYYESEKNGWLYLENNGCADYWQDGLTYKVTARWGYAETPLEIVEAVTQIIVRWWETNKGVIGQITPNGFVIERDMPPAAKTLLAQFIKREFEI